MNRRHFLWGAASSGLLLDPWFAPASAMAPSDAASGPMEPWSRGLLDIHHIATGRGNCVLAICPDGTSIMIDAGSGADTTEAVGPARPNDSRRPGEWLGRYALRSLKTTPRQELDYFVLTHFHDDHMGALFADSPFSRNHAYKLTGVTDVAELVPIRCLLDRGFPNYNYPAPSTYDALVNYVNFARYESARGTEVERFQVGSRQQIALQHDPDAFRTFAVQNLSANGEVWTGQGTETVKLFPDISSLKEANLPTENACSIALRLTFGDFRYYIGGDLTCFDRYGTAPWMDVESPVSRVAGPASVAVLNHHGYYDATGVSFVRNMRARVYVIQTWHASHPALAVLDELYSPVLSPGPHDVFATGLVSAAHLADARLSDKMLSQHGHVVIRVFAGGDNYKVYVLDESKEEGNVMSEWGPYKSSNLVIDG